MNEKKNNTLLLTVIGVATLLVAVIGATFAYFTAQTMGAPTTDTIHVAAGKLEIAYENGTRNLESVSGIEPAAPGVYAISKEFTIAGTNTTTAIMPYGIEIVVQYNSFTENALTYTLTSTNTGGNGLPVPTVTAPRGIPNAQSGEIRIPLGIGHFAGVVNSNVHTYVLRIYFTSSGVPQDEDKGKEFRGFVNTTVQSAYTTTVAP